MLEILKTPQVSSRFLRKRVEKRKLLSVSPVGNQGFPVSPPRSDKGEGSAQGNPQLPTLTPGPPWSFTGSLPASLQPTSRNGISLGTWGSPRGSTMPDPSPHQTCRPPSPVVRVLPGHFSGSPAWHRVSAPPPGSPHEPPPGPPERREPTRLPAEKAAPHAGPGRQNREAARRPGPGAVGAPGPRPTLRRSSRPRGRQAAGLALLRHPPPPPSHQPPSPCSPATRHPRVRTALSHLRPPPLAKEEP